MKILIFILLFSTTLFSQELKTNYVDYHDQINKAETFLYKENNLDSCFYYYDKTFKEFDFIFVKDLVNAAQIAKLNKREFKKYIIQGFENGLKLNHLDDYPIFEDIVNDLKKDKKINQAFTKNRENYLKRIDFDYLNRIYDLVTQDRKNRNLDKKKYQSKLPYNLSVLKKLIETKGFPSDKLIGISDSTIFKEIKSLKKDISVRELAIPSKLKAYKIVVENNLSQYFLESFIMNSNLCFFKINEKEVLLKEIKRGNLHPRDIAFLSDLAFYNANNNNLNYCGSSKLYPLFFKNTNELKYFNIYKAQEIRKEFHMVSYDVELLKEDYQTKNNLRLFFGNYNQR